MSGVKAAYAAYGSNAQRALTDLDSQLHQFANMSTKERAFHDMFSGGPTELENRKAMIERSEMAWQGTMDKQNAPGMMQQFGQGLMNQAANQIGSSLQGGLSRVMSRAMEPINKLVDRVVNQITTPPHEQILQGMTETARRGRMIIQDDLLGLITEQLPPAAREFVAQLTMLTRAIVEKGRMLSVYSGPLAEATARADVRSMLADIREAQGPGREYARVIDQQSKLENTFRNALNPAKEAIAGAVANLLEGINNLVNSLHIPEALVTVGEVLKVVSAFTSMDPQKISDAIINLPENIAKAIDEYLSDSDEGLDQAIRQAWFDLGMNKGLGRGQAPLADKARFGNPGRMNFPVVQGI